MPLKLAERQEALGDKLYFFPSKDENEDRCLIWAHGGLLYADQKESQNFLPPRGVVMYFVQKEHNRDIDINFGQFMGYEPNFKTMEKVPNGELVRNYSLSKAVGKHWNGEKVSYERIRTYVDGAKHTGQWPPHVVVIRNKFRLIGTMVVKLKDVVEAIKNRLPGVKEIYVMACRGEASKLQSLKYRT